MKYFCSLVLAVCLLTTLSEPVLAQKERLAPTHADVAYDDGHEAQKLDVYLSKSKEKVPVVIYIHGGGWRAGSKASVPGFLLQAVQEGWCSVVSVGYRFTDVETHPAQVDDCLRAVQFIRENAVEWNLDAERIAVGGGSAGGHLSLYIALHDDVADAASEDKVEKNSSRVTCAISFAGPTDWTLLGKMAHLHPAYRQLIGYEPGTEYEKLDKEKVADVSPITFASKDDPPVLLVHGDADMIVPLQHAEQLHKRLQEVGGKSELFVVKDGGHGIVGGKGVPEKVVQFVKEKLDVGDGGSEEQAE